MLINHSASKVKQKKQDSEWTTSNNELLGCFSRNSWNLLLSYSTDCCTRWGLMLLTAKFAMSSFIKSSTENISLEAEEERAHGEIWSFPFYYLWIFWKHPQRPRRLLASALTSGICSWINPISFASIPSSEETICLGGLFPLKITWFHCSLAAVP